MRSIGPTLERWAEIRAAYETGKSLSALARAFGTTRQTIRRHARDEGWIIQADSLVYQVTQNPKATPQEIARATRANVIQLSTKRAFEAQSSKVREQVTQTLEDLLERQLPLAARTMAFAENLIAKIESGELKAEGRDTSSALISAVLNASRTATEVVREIAGLKAGQPSVAFAKAKTQRRFTVVEAPPQETKTKVAS